MRRYRPVFPYENEHREELMSLPFQVFLPRRITLFCQELCCTIKEDAPVCQGQCIGWVEERPVYSGIDGRVEKISVDESGYSRKKYRVSIRKESHRMACQSFVPFLRTDGNYFLRQLGLMPPEGMITEKDVLWVDGVESEPFSASGYRLFAEETVKIILGADVLGSCYGVQKVKLCIEKQWKDIYFLLEKYLKKYRCVLNKDIQYEICSYTRCCPAPYLVPGRLIFYPQILIHAYNGYYEKIPASSAYITVSGHVLRKSNFIMPAGTHVGDIIAACGLGKNEPCKFVLDGVMTGHAVSPENAVIMPENTSLCVVEWQTREESPCVGCHACAAVCPMHLKPYAPDAHTFDSCIQCGCCSYVCPSNIRISEKIKHKVKDKKNHKKKRAKFRKKLKHGTYIEIAPEFADFIETMEICSDAPPHIHCPADNLSKKIKCLMLLLPLYAWAVSAYGVIILCHGAIAVMAALIVAEISKRIVKTSAGADIYIASVLYAAAAVLILPVGVSVLTAIIAYIIACILGVYNL